MMELNDVSVLSVEVFFVVLWYELDKLLKFKLG